MTGRALRSAIVIGFLGSALGPAWAEGAAAGLDLDEGTRCRCLAVLRQGLGSKEFCPGMHAAEALSLAGYGNEVRAAIAPKLPPESDDQRRCGLARELVR